MFLEFSCSWTYLQLCYPYCRGDNYAIRGIDSKIKDHQEVPVILQLSNCTCAAWGIRETEPTQLWTRQFEDSKYTLRPEPFSQPLSRQSRDVAVASANNMSAKFAVICSLRMKRWFFLNLFSVLEWSSQGLRTSFKTSTRHCFKYVGANSASP